MPPHLRLLPLIWAMPPRIVAWLIIWQMSWDPNGGSSSGSRSNNKHRHLFDRIRGRDEEEAGVAAYDGFNGLSNALATSRLHLRLAERPLLTIFDSLLALLWFVIYLTIICAACPLPLPTPHSLHFLNNEHYVEKQENLLFHAFCKAFAWPVLGLGFSFGMQSEPHAKWVPISFVYSECN